MKKIWKRAAALALAGAMAGSLGGCGQGKRLAAGVTTDNAIITSMNTESGSLDSAGDSSLWWWSYGLIVCYAFGTAWFMMIYTQHSGVIGLSTVLGLCVIPFIIPDLIKIGVALFLINRLKKR